MQNKGNAMKYGILIAALLPLFSGTLSAQRGMGGMQGWNLFEGVPFEEVFLEEQGISWQQPKFDKGMKAMEGQVITLRGHVIILDAYIRLNVILSRFPSKACFFCAASGPETIAEVELANKPRRLLNDQIITVRGKLKLNESDPYKLNFILQEAEIIGE